MVVLLILKVKVVTRCLTNTTNRFPSFKLSQIYTSLMFPSELVYKYDITIFHFPFLLGLRDVSYKRVSPDGHSHQMLCLF